MKRNVGTIAAMSIVATIALAGPAHGAESSGDSTVEALEHVTSLDGDAATAVLDNVAAVAPPASPELVVDAAVAGTDIRVPVDATEKVTINDVSVTLPFSNQADPATSELPGVVSFDNNNGTSSSAVVKDDGSLQLLTVIDGPDAPDRFAYSLDIPEGATIDFLPDGGALVTNDGSLVLGIAAPWAVDADGSAVPTTYELSGSTLTQVVDHRGKDVTYPIVADPWLGAAIFQQVYQNASLQYISVVPSQWGAAIQAGAAGGVAGWAAGQAILKSAGWDELRGKAPIANNKATYRQQYDCHVLGAYVPFTGGVAWDLEGTRSNNPYWINNAASHLCNWR